MMYLRPLSKIIVKSSKSVLLLGPRQTGKSTLIKGLNPDLTINLSREKTFLDYASNPTLLENTLAAGRIKSIFIDEIQRIPSLLNTVQSIIDDSPKKYKFYLTGSSARKLKRGSANLLPGRIIAFNLSPLTIEELGADFNLKQALSTGTLPGIYSHANLKEKKLILSTYGATYLKEEIQSEALTKNIEGFSRFLFIAASKNAEFLDFAKMGALANITQKTASRFFEILDDTLIVHRLNAYAKSDFRRLIQHPKFYFFDNGVLNALLGNFNVSEDRKGMLFETFVVNQIKSWANSQAIDLRMSTYRTDGGAEIDVILEADGKTLALEIKHTKNIGNSDVSAFTSFAKIHPQKFKKMLIYTGEHLQKINDVEIYPTIQGFKKICEYFETRGH